MDNQKHYGSASRGWVRNICQVDWTCIFFIITLGIATGVVQRVDPIQRPIYLGDATIAFPHRDSNSIQFWVALFIPALVLLISAAAVEFIIYRKQGQRQAWLMLLNVVLAALAALAVTGFMTELFKRICGRLRPDFLDRCQPLEPAAGTNLVPFGTVPSITCTAAATKELLDGKQSFPSGHSSCSMVLGMFGALYLLWAVHLRAHRDMLGPMSACKSGGLCLRAWLRAELLRLLVLLVVLFQLAWPWGVAISRFRDNRHNVSDVVAGLLLGACFAPLFMSRLAWHYAGWSDLQQQEASGLQLQLQMSSTSHSPLPVHHALPPTSSNEYNGHSVSHSNNHFVAVGGSQH